MSAPSFPTRKISETIIDFAEPLLVPVDSTTPEAFVRHCFLIAVTVWNAFVLDKVKGNTKYQTLIQQQFGADPHAAQIFKVLADRRLKHFADDMRLVAEHRVSFDTSGYKLWAAASDPYALMKE